MIKKILTLFISLFVCLSAVAKEVHYLVRSPKALLMGDAYTAICDDEYTLFYNPAVLGSHKGVSMNFLNPDLGLTNVYSKEDREKFDNFPTNDPAKIANRIMDYPVHLHLGITPTLKLESFSFSLLANWTSNYILRNSVAPNLDVDFIYDRGFVAGYAYSVGRGGQKSKKGQKMTGMRSSIGFGIKHIKREALQGSFPLFGTSLLNAISSRSDEGFSKIRNDLGYSKGNGWGADLGLQWQYAGSNYDLLSGFSIMDIGHTNFKKEHGINDIPRQEMMMNFGVAYKYNLGIFNSAVSLDFHPINSPIDFATKTHFGFSADVLGYGVYGGWNGGYLSYGVSANVFFMKLLAGFYSVELGTERGEKEGKRAIIYLSFLDFSFEP